MLARFGGFAGLEVIEIGAGRGTNGLLYAERGANVTLLDQAPLALEQARQIFAARGLPVTTPEADLFDLPAALLDRFGVSMSFGLCEHFWASRLAVVAAHLGVLRSGGIAMLGVPNRFSPVYRLWIAVLMRRGRGRLARRFRSRHASSHGWSASGGVPWTGLRQPSPPSSGGVNQLLYKLGRRGFPAPQLCIPLVDRLAYELLVPAVRLPRPSRRSRGCARSLRRPRSGRGRAPPGSP